MSLALSKATIESQIASRVRDVFKLNEKAVPEVISTGIPEVDVLTGLPRGAITEIYGPASSGRTSLILSALAQATTHEEVCALVDTNDVLDPASVAKAMVDLERLLWVRCAGNLEHSFKATDLLLQGGGFGLVVLDLGDVPTKDARRIISSWWYRFRRVVENTPTALVVITQSACVRSCASLTLELRKEADVWSSTNEPQVSVDFKSAVSTGTSQESAFNKLSKTQVIKNKGSTCITHSTFLCGSYLRLDRLKPVHLTERVARIEAYARS